MIGIQYKLGISYESGTKFVDNFYMLSDTNLVLSLNIWYEIWRLHALLDIFE